LDKKKLTEDHSGGYIVREMAWMKGVQ